MKNWLDNWALGHALMMLLATYLFTIWDNHFMLAIWGIFSFGIMLVWNGKEKNSFAFLLEPANIFTLVRLALVIVLIYIHHELTFLGIALICLSVLILDFLDGYLAKKYHTVSEIGAVFDKQTDYFLILAGVTLLYHFGFFKSWCLWVGVLPYLFAIFQYFSPIKGETTTSGDNFSRISKIVLTLSIVGVFGMSHLPMIHKNLFYIANLLTFFSLGLTISGKSLALTKK